MSQAKFAVIALAVLAGVAGVQADIIWDNYLTSPDGYDSISAFTSERNTNVVDSWAGDDAIFGAPVTVTGVEWLAIRDPDYQYTAEVVVLDENFDIVNEYIEMDYAATVVTPDPLFGYQVYSGYIDLGGLDLPAGQYYFAVRLFTGGAGRNMILTTGDGTINGLSMGVVQSDHFGIANWTEIASAWPGAPVTDLAYRIHGVPEPASLVLLAGGLFMLRRR